MRSGARLDQVSQVEPPPPGLLEAALEQPFALLGALLGTTLGVKRLPAPMILKALGVVLAIAGLKLILT